MSDLLLSRCATIGFSLLAAPFAAPGGEFLGQGAARIWAEAFGFYSLDPCIHGCIAHSSRF